MLKKKLLAVPATAALAVAAGLAGAPSAQAAPLVTGGLVNVTVTEVVDDVTVTVQDVNVGLGAALGVAANVCDVNVNVLAQQLREGGATCTSVADGQTVELSQL